MTTQDDLNDRERFIGRIFRVGLLVKAAHSFIELTAGTALCLAPNATIIAIARYLTSNELLEDPNDIVANYLLQSAEALSVDAKTAATFYLLSHGAVKLYLVVMVLREHRWAYPLFMAALVSLVVYQTYQLSLGFSAWLTALTLFDVLVLWLTWHEYRLHRRGRISN